MAITIFLLSEMLLIMSIFGFKPLYMNLNSNYLDRKLTEVHSVDSEMQLFLWEDSLCATALAGSSVTPGTSDAIKMKDATGQTFLTDPSLNGGNMQVLQATKVKSLTISGLQQDYVGPNNFIGNINLTLTPITGIGADRNYTYIVRFLLDPSHTSVVNCYGQNSVHFNCDQYKGTYTAGANPPCVIPSLFVNSCPTGQYLTGFSNGGPVCGP